jgi:PQQ-dependent catabolism-associated CXXCW motif protein
MRRFLRHLPCYVLPALLYSGCPPAMADSPVPLLSATGYRLSHYRSPTPASAEHARTLDTAALQTLLHEQPQTLLIDVYPRQWLHGQFIQDPPHANLPGSVWLANTGDGELAPRWQNYFSDNLRRLSHGNQQQPLVFYCRADCWLSWNASKRAAALGYQNLYWYRDGIDAWEQAGQRLQPAQPQALP